MCYCSHFTQDARWVKIDQNVSALVVFFIFMNRWIIKLFIAGKRSTAFFLSLELVSLANDVGK